MILNRTVFLILLILLPAQLMGGDTVYVVDFKIGSVHIRKPGDKNWKPLVKGNAFSAPGIIRTGHRGHLVLLKQGRQFLVGRNRIVNLREIDSPPGRGNLFLVKQRLRHALTDPVNLRRTTVSAVRGKKASAGMGLTWMDDLKTPSKYKKTFFLKNALTAYEKEDYKKAVKIIKGILAVAEGDLRSNRRHLLMLSYFQDGQYSRSLLVAELLLAGTWKNSLKKTDAYFIGAMAADYSSQSGRAVSLMEQFIRWHPRSCFVPDAKVLMGEIYLKNGQRREGERCLQEVLEKYPESEAAAAIKKSQKSN